MGKLPRLRPFDYIFAVLALGLIVAVAVTVYSSVLDPSRVRVQTAQGEFVYDLETDAVVDFDGPIGITVIEVKDRAARVVSSPCREQICVSSGALHSSGDWTACLPNRIFLQVTGADETEIDGLSY